MKLIKIFSLVLVTSLCLGNMAKADEASKRALVIELMEVAKISSLMDQMMQATYTQISTALNQQQSNLPPRVFEILDEEMKEGSKNITPIMLEGFEALYSKYFTEAELKELIEFQKSPVGQKSVKLMPTLMQEGMAIGQNAATQAMPAIMEKFQKRLLEEGIK